VADQSVPDPMTLIDPNPDFKVTVYLQVKVSKMVRLRDKVTIEH